MSLLTVGLLALVAIAGGIKGAYVRTIRGYLGEPLIDFLKMNHEKIPLERRYDDTPVIFPDSDLSGGTFHFIYGKPGDEIDFPRARLLWFSQYAGTITEATINTSQQKESLEAIYKECFQIRGEFIRGGWQEVQALPGYVDLQQAIGKGEGTTAEFSAAKYIKNGAEALLMLSTPGGVVTPDKLSQDSFVMKVWFHDEALGDRESKKAYTARKQVNGNVNIALPLSYWLK